MKLRFTKLCLDCDELWDQGKSEDCPCCTSKKWIFISRLIPPMTHERIKDATHCTSKV